MFVKPNIYKVDCTDGSYVYAISNEYGISLIDTHFPGKGEEIAAELKAAGMEPVERILLTHSDMDHTGNAAFLQQKYDCPVYLSAREMEAVQDKTKSKDGKSDPLAGLERPELSVFEGDTIAGITIVPAYGHTWGHVCFLYDGVLFAGDLICTEDGIIKEMELRYIRDRTESWKAIEAVDAAATFDLLCPSHGEPLSCSKLEVGEWRKA